MSLVNQRAMGGISSMNQAPQPVRETEIPQQLQRIRVLISQTLESFNSLYARLIPVIQPDTPQGPETDSPKAEKERIILTPLGNEMNDVAIQLQTLNRGLIRLTERLET